MGNLKVVAALAAVIVLRVSHAAELCLTGDFDSQFAHVLRNQVLTHDRIRNMSLVFKDLENTLNERWPGAVVTPMGSLVAGLGMKASDTDCHVQLPRQDEERAVMYFVAEATKLLGRYPTIYQQLNPKIRHSTPIINFLHAPTNTFCSVSFKNSRGLQISRLVSYYMSLDKRVRLVTVFLKIWSQVHNIASSRKIPSYGLSFLAIFYFQQKKILPPISVLQRNATTHYVDGWNTGFDRLPYEIMNTESIYELVRGFFDYYGEFNFEDYMVSPYAGRPIRKRDFSDVDTVPEEFVLYRRRVREHSCEPAEPNTELWVQDAFAHDISMTKHVDPAVSSLFVFLVKSAATSFAILPRNRVLRTILVHHESDRELKNGSLKVEISEDCSKSAVHFRL